MKTFYFSISILLSSWKLLAQAGCQDPLATNFNQLATSTNSSCTYANTNAGLTTRIGNLPSILNETSALLITDGKVFTINDSGNAADLFEIDSATGFVKKKTRISNYSNVDWEDIAADSTNIYIGDFGNNNGTRTDLRILKVKKSSVYNPDSLNIRAERIRFSYPDQTNFTSSNNHNFDCESIVFFNGKLHLFSKNRGNKKTKHYSLDPSLPLQIATLHDSLNVNGLITSASIRQDGKVLVLLGLDQTGSFPVFAWLLFGFEGSNFFSGNRRRIELPNAVTTGQAEGIGFASNYRLWISNETVSIVSAGVKQLNIGPYINSYFTNNEELITDESSVKIWPNPVSEVLKIKKDGTLNFRLSNSIGKEVFYGNGDNIDVSFLPEGLYHLSFLEEKLKIGNNNFLILVKH
jgi:hypothetical protein